MRLHLYIIGLLMLAACQKKVTPDPVSFSVKSDSTAYHVGSTTLFSFSGNPDDITFFSGERGHRYPYRSRITAAGTPVLQFSTALNAGVQPNSLYLLASTDFKGVVVGDTVTTIGNIGSATWTDLSGRATWATGMTTTASGAINLSDLAAAGKPIFLAFHYLATSGSIQNKWTITGLTMTNTLADSSVYTIANLAASTTPITSNYGGATTYSPGWVAYTVSNTYPWTITAGTSLVIAGAATAAAATANAEAWTIMGPLNLQKVTPDMGVAIKAITAALPSYTYTYGSAGSYSAVFVAVNATSDKTDSVSRTIGITIQ